MLTTWFEIWYKKYLLTWCAHWIFTPPIIQWQINLITRGCYEIITSISLKRRHHNRYFLWCGAGCMRWTMLIKVVNLHVQFLYIFRHIRQTSGHPVIPICIPGKYSIYKYVIGTYLFPYKSLKKSHDDPLNLKRE